MKTVTLHREKYILVHRLYFGGSRTVIVFGDFRHDDVLSVFDQPFRPGHRHQNDKDKKRQPDNDGFTKLPGMILTDDPVEIQQPEKRPGGQKHICLCRDRIVGKRIREKQEYRKSSQNVQTDPADQAILFAAFLPRSLIYSQGCKAINNGGADRRGVHDPPDRRSSEERYRQRDEQHQKYGVDRDLLFVEFGKTLGQDTILRHGEAQTAQCAEHADQTGENQ